MSSYFKRIELRGLWGKCDVDWDLNPNVNILSGINGSGKSTLIQAVANVFRTPLIYSTQSHAVQSVNIYFDDGDVIRSGDAAKLKHPNIDIISTFDSSLKESQTLQKLSDGNVRTDLDWNIYQLQKRYLTFQLTQGKRTIEMLQSGASKQELNKLIEHKIHFYSLVDELFEKSGKKIDRNADELSFLLGDKEISAYQLSSGEKQMLLIMTTVLTENMAPYILLMDEPEISLHFDWQQRLIEIIKELNPNVQIIMATHSPAVIMNGWFENVSEISELTTTL